MTNSNRNISLSAAAIISGIAILVMAVTAPFAELYVFPKLIVYGNPVATTDNILSNINLFAKGIFAYLLTFIADIIAAWSLYILLKPVNRNLSLLMALFRFSYSIIAIVALLNLVSLFKLLNSNSYSAFLTTNQVQSQVMLSLTSFKNGWSFDIIIFGLHLLLLGFLIIQSKYIPKILGLLVLVSGSGYIITELNPYFFGNIDMHIARYTFLGELIFMLWLLIRGYKIEEQT
jgi:hypothetical protein